MPEREFVQPTDIPVPDRSDPLYWALLTRTHIQWIQSVAEQFPDLDVDKYILGHVLACVIGDDGNCFAWYRMGCEYNIDLARKSKPQLVERMKIEIGTPQVPEQIREMVEKTLAYVSGKDWENKEQFLEANWSWEEFKMKVKEIIKTSPDLETAMTYNLAVIKASPQIMHRWHEFLGELPEGETLA